MAEWCSGVEGWGFQCDGYEFAWLKERIRGVDELRRKKRTVLNWCIIYEVFLGHPPLNGNS